MYLPILFGYGTTVLGLRSSEALPMTDLQLKWYVVYTRPRWEKKVAVLLDSAGINHYCPLNKVNKQWSDRKKVVLEPLFKGYVFVQVSEAEKWSIKSVEGIVNYVYWLGKPAIVRDEDIVTIKRFLQEFEDVKVTDNKLNINQSVLIKQGVLMNYKGIVIELIGSKAKVKIDSLGLVMSATFDKKNLIAV